MRYLNCWANKNFWGARTGPLTHASAVNYNLQIASLSFFHCWFQNKKKKQINYMNFAWKIISQTKFKIKTTRKRTSSLALPFWTGRMGRHIAPDISPLKSKTQNNIRWFRSKSFQQSQIIIFHFLKELWPLSKQTKSRPLCKQDVKIKRRKKGQQVEAWR